MPEFDPIRYLTKKYQEAKDYVAQDPELSTYMDIAKTTALPALKHIAKAGAEAFKYSSPAGYAFSESGNPTPSNDVLGQIAHVPGGQAVVDPSMLTAGGTRIYSALKSLAEKHDWAQKAVEWMEGPLSSAVHNADTLNITNPDLRRMVPPAYKEVPGMGPKRKELFAQQIEKEPLPETQFSPVEGGLIQKEKEQSAFDAEQDRKNKESYDRFQKDKEEQNAKWAQDPSFRRVKGYPAGWPFEMTAVRPEEGAQSLNPQWELERLKAVKSRIENQPEFFAPYGQGTSSLQRGNEMGLLERSIEALERRIAGEPQTLSPLEGKPKEPLSPMEDYLDAADQAIRDHIPDASVEHRDAIIHGHATGKGYISPGLQQDLDALMEQHKVQPEDVVNKLSGEEPTPNYNEDDKPEGEEGNED